MTKSIHEQLVEKIESRLSRLTGSENVYTIGYHNALNWVLSENEKLEREEKCSSCGRLLDEDETTECGSCIKYEIEAVVKEKLERRIRPVCNWTDEWSEAASEAKLRSETQGAKWSVTLGAKEQPKEIEVINYEVVFGSKEFDLEASLNTVKIIKAINDKLVEVIHAVNELRRGK